MEFKKSYKALIVLMAFVMVLGITNTASAQVDKAIKDFMPDTELQKIVAKKLTNDENKIDHVLTPEDVLKTTSFGDIYEPGIESLEGLQYFTNLKVFIFRRNNDLVTIPSSIFENAKGIDYIHFNLDGSVEEIPASLFEVDSLTYFNLTNTVNDKLPESISKHVN